MNFSGKSTRFTPEFEKGNILYNGLWVYKKGRLMYLGIDIGTSAIKVIIIDETGHLVNSASRPLQVERPQIGYSEQDPQSWWQAVDAAMAELRTAMPEEMRAVKAIGLSGQMHGLVTLDKKGDVLRPAILWNDTRCAIEAAALDENEPAFRAIGGNAVMAGFTAPKAEWMRRHEPDLFAAIDTILLPKDYVRFCMSGEKVAEMSDAAGTLWLDVKRRDWSDELLAACGLKRAQMPRLIEGAEISASITDDIAKRWGVPKGIPIAGGGGDNAAASIGLGVIAPGDGFVSLGTSGVVFMVTDDFAPAADSGAHAFCHALPSLWHQMGVILAASDCVSWLCDITGRDVENLMQEMAKTDLLATMPLFHPYLSGERTPHNDANATAGFLGLRRGDSAGDMARGVLQGVSFAIADCLDVLRDAGAVPTTLLATGGGSNNEIWLRYIASVTDCPISVPLQADIGAALGAARLAMIADGHKIETICIKPPIGKTIKPDPEWAARLKPARQKWQKAYQAIAPLIQA